MASVTMETILKRQQQQLSPVDGSALTSRPANLHAALSGLSIVLRDLLPLLGSTGNETNRMPLQQSSMNEGKTQAGDSVTNSWLMDLCSQIPSELTPEYLAQSVWEIARQHTSSSNSDMQAALLFETLGASDEAMGVLALIMPALSEIAKLPRPQRPSEARSHTVPSTEIDLEEERRQLLRHEALEARALAELARQELWDQHGDTAQSVMSTHTVTRKSDVQRQRNLEKLEKKAAQAMERAKQAGVMFEEELGGASGLFRQLEGVTRGPGGLMHKSAQDLETLQATLLPSGSKKYYNDSGLPIGTIFEQSKEYEKVTIPAMPRDESRLPNRIRIADVMSEECQRAFAGTLTLNPMQSTVFEVAFHTRESMLVCAPTGAGKTNVAMLTVVAHFRDVGLLPGTSSAHGRLDTGPKVVYIAPMKALAQEVVEKFSSKLKPLRLIVRELTGDMQLTRAEAESADVIVTTPEKWDVVTRKSGTDELSLGNQCGLLIIDEVGTAA